MLINVNATSFNENQMISLEREFAAGACAVEVTIEPAETAEGQVLFEGKESCSVTATPSPYQLGLQVRIEREGHCEELEVETRITIIDESVEDTSEAAGASSSSRLAVSRVIARDPVARPLVNHAERLLFTYTDNDVLSWSRDALIFLFGSGWDVEVLSEGDRYHIRLKAVESWSRIWSKPQDRLEDSLLVISQDVEIWTRSRVWGLQGGGYSCSSSATITGQLRFLGVAITQIPVSKYCFP